MKTKLPYSKGKNISFPYRAHGNKFQFGTVDENNVYERWRDINLPAERNVTACPTMTVSFAENSKKFLPKEQQLFFPL